MFDLTAGVQYLFFVILRSIYIYVWNIVCAVIFFFFWHMLGHGVVHRVELSSLFLES